MTGEGMPSADALGGMISALMSNPELLQNIKNAIGNIPEKTEKDISKEEEKESADNSEEISDSVPATVFPADIMNKLPLIMNALSGKGKSKSEKEREALLCALKPYLSSEKAQKIDKLISFMRIGDILSGI